MDLSHVDGAGELIEVVSDPAEFVRDPINALDHDDLFPEDTVPEIVAQLIISPGFLFQPRLFFGGDAEGNDDIFCLHFVQIDRFLSV